MKLLLVATAVIAAVHYGHSTTINKATTVCELAQMFVDAMQEAEDMECHLLLGEGETFSNPFKAVSTG